jgi:RecB family exonuclease
MTPAAWDHAVQSIVEAACAASPTNGHPAPPIAPPEPQHELKPLSPGDALSPSQVNTFLSCPAKWMYRYLLGLPDPQTSARFVGACFHRTVEAYFRFRLENKAEPEDLGAFLDGSYEIDWAEGVGGGEFMDSEDPAELRELGRSLLEVVLRDEAPSIQPAAMEVRVDGDIAGVPVRGIIDLLDVDGRVIDLKTAAKAPSGIRPDYRLQVTAYSMLSGAAKGAARLYTVTKTKTIKVVQQSFDVTTEDVAYARVMYPMVRDAIRDGLFYPRRDSMFCSRKWCGYWRECVREFGGEVD